MIAKEMSPLEIETDKYQPASPPKKRQVDGLGAGIAYDPALPNCVRSETKPAASLEPDGSETKVPTRFAVTAPELALKVPTDLGDVERPPRPVGRVERVGFGDDSVGVVDGDAGPAGDKAELGFAGRRSGGDNDAGPSFVSKCADRSSPSMISTQPSPAR